MACFGPLRGASHDTIPAFWATIFGYIGDGTAFFLYFMAGCTFCAIVSNEAVGEFSPYPSLVGLFTCGFWVLYGVPTTSILVMVINAVGAVVQLANVSIFQGYAEEQDVRRDRVCIILVFEAIFTSVVATLVLVFVPQESKSIAFGFVAAGCAVAMYASPIHSMVLAYQAGNAQHLDVTMAFASLVNAAIWTVYAVLAKDRFALVPNAVGVVVGLVQTYEYFHFTFINPPPPADDGQ